VCGRPEAAAALAATHSSRRSGSRTGAYHAHGSACAVVAVWFRRRAASQTSRMSRSRAKRHAHTHVFVCVCVCARARVVPLCTLATALHLSSVWIAHACFRPAVPHPTLTGWVLTVGRGGAAQVLTGVHLRCAAVVGVHLWCAPLVATV
jgi:hypothetical protein